MKKIVLVLIAVIVMTGALPNLALASETTAASSAAAVPETAKTNIFEATRTDFRDESVYNLIITRFYDGDSSNNVHCWDDGQAGNPDSDPGWQGDFKGLTDKLDYIKALGFTAVQLNPVAQNASGYDYHGEHPINLKKIDVRYQSDGYDYQKLIDACHAKGLKVIQEVQINGTSNFGEGTLSKLFDINEEGVSSVQEFSDKEKMLVPTQTLLDAFGLSSAEEYWNQTDAIQYNQRLNLIKNTEDTTVGNTTGSYPADADYESVKISSSSVYNPRNYYHTGYFSDLNWDNWTVKYAQIAGDSVDLNTENYVVGQYLAESLKMYADYGVDAIYINDAREMNRLSLNLNVIQPLKQMLAEDGQHMEIFADVVTRYTQIWYRDRATESTPFYTWADDAKWKNLWSYDGSAESVNNNMNVSFDFIKETDDTANQPTSNNAFLNGITYHTPDYAKSSGMKVFDFQMHRLFGGAYNAFQFAYGNDQYYNDSTWNITSVDTEDYSPEQPDEKVRFSGGTQAWRENLALMFTFRGIPRILYGSEVEFQKGATIDIGASTPLSLTGRAYYGDYMEGTVEATDFGEYTANGTIAETLDSELSDHIRQLNEIRRKVPALRKGQYTIDRNYVSGDMAFIRRYTDETVDSLALVAISGDATFKNIPNGTYVNAVDGAEIEVTDGTLSVSLDTQGDYAVYVCGAEGFTSLDTAFEADETYSMSFDANGGSGTMETVPASYGYVALPECTFTAPAEKVFQAWSVNDKEYAAGSYAQITADTVAKAIWRDIVYCDISFDANGGSGTMETVNIVEGEYTLPQCTFTAPYGKSFQVWSIGNREYAVGETVEISTDTEIKAVWQDITLSVRGDTVTATGLPQSAQLVVESYCDGAVVDSEIIDVSGFFQKTIAEIGIDLSTADTLMVSVRKDSVTKTPLRDSLTVAVIDGEINKGRIYFRNTDDWSTVYAFYWSDDDVYSASWPGNPMTNISGSDIWYIEVPEEAQYIIFNSGTGSQTNDLTIPTDGSNLYTYSTGKWTGNSVSLTLTAESVGVSMLFESAQLIVASYSGQKLLDVKTLQVSADVEKTLSEIGLDLTNADTIKAFLWKDTTGMKPLCVSCSIAIITETEGNNFIYFKNTDSWTVVNAYYWSDSNMSFTTWPGKELTNLGGDVWYLDVPEEAQYIIFNNGSAQTSDLVIPTNGSNLYTYSTGNWSSY